MGRALPFVLLLAAGCGLVLDLDARGVAGGGGPDGSAADAGTIDGDATPPPDAARADAADIDAGPIPTPPCGGPSALRDGFEDDARSPYWQVEDRPGHGVTEQSGGRLRTSVAEGVAPSWAGYTSSFAYDARDDRAAVEVVRVDESPTVTTFFALLHDEANYAMIVHAGGSFAGVVYEGGAATSFGVSRRFDLGMHRWWQLRGDRARGVVVFEVSPDATAWMPIHEAPAPRWLEAVHVGLGVFTMAATTSPDRAEMDNLNLDPGHPVTGYCPADTFSDAFDGTGPGVDPLRWFVPEACGVSRGSGAVSITGVLPTGDPCGILTRHGYDLAAAPATVRLAPGSEPGDLVFGVTDAAGNAAWAACDGGLLHLVSPGSTTTGTCPTERVWRLQLLGAALLMSVSDDGVAYHEQARVALGGLDPTALRVGIGAAPGTTVSVAGYNVP